jgi:hypothetical protein
MRNAFGNGARPMTNRWKRSLLCVAAVFAALAAGCTKHEQAGGQATPSVAVMESPSPAATVAAAVSETPSGAAPQASSATPTEESSKAAAPYPTIVSAELGTDATPDYRVVNAATQFAPDVPQIVCVVHLADLGRATTMKAVWIAQDTGGAMPADAKLMEKALDVPAASGQTFGATFSMTKQSGAFPAGKYRVEIYFDTTLVDTVPFTIAKRS